MALSYNIVKIIVEDNLKKGRVAMAKNAWFFIVFLILLIFCLPLYVEADVTDEEKIISVEHELNVNNSGLDNEVRVTSIAQQFQMDAEVVRHLRDSGQGWGEISIELSMANYLHSLHPETYATKYDALDKISALRAEGSGWGEIAQSLGFKLGPVISSVKSGRHIEPGKNAFKGQPDNFESKAHKVRSVKAKNSNTIRTRIASRHRVTYIKATHVRVRPARSHRPMRPGR